MFIHILLDQMHVCCLFLYTTKPAINATATITTTIIDASTHHIHGLVPDPETLALFDGVIVVELFPATVVFVDMDTETDIEADADVAFTKDTELDGVGEVAFGEGDALIEADGDKVDVLPFKAQPASAHIWIV